MLVKVVLLTVLTPLSILFADVKISSDANGFQIIRDGKPYLVKGAVGAVRLKELAAAGANSIRSGPTSLDMAQELGLSVLVGLPLGKQRWGFDYSDPASLAKQRDEIRRIVIQYKDHPAVLIWAIGNEPEIRTTEEQRRLMWAEIDRLAVMIRELDPHHPVITVIGDAYRRILHEAKQLCPHLDAMGLNSYQDMLTLPEDVAAEGWDKAYLITEFGPRGHWQVQKTSWKVPLEDTSSEKADFYERAYRHAVLGQPRCLGSYVFHWGQHQEKTQTWYGMFLEDGSRTESIDRMTFLWSSKWPANRSPKVSPIQISRPADAIPAGSTIELTVVASDPEGDALEIEWEMRPDVADNPNVGGDKEPPSAPIPGVVLAQKGSKATLKVPETPANYRVFVYVRDGHGNAATANLPIKAVPGSQPPTG
jgi:hypothetical protein